ncbi:hypothetical protein JOM56_009338 [Amanita muscaria]
MDGKLEAVADFRSSDCPINTLPNEVLSSIFDEFTSAPAEMEYEPASAALVLSHVCHRWKTVLTPSQWATVRVRHLHHQKILDTILTRSGKHELDVSLRLGNIDANYFITKDIDMVKTQWRIFSLFNTLADHQDRLRHLIVEAKQAVLEWLEDVTMVRPFMALTHLTLIQTDKNIHMHNFAESCFDLASCASLTLEHVSIIPKNGAQWSSLRELRLLDIRSYDLMGWTYNMEIDDAGYYQWESRQDTCFSSVESLTISNTFFIRREPQVFDFLSLFPSVCELELDCVDDYLVLDILEKDASLMPGLRRVTVDGVDVYSAVDLEKRYIEAMERLSL